MNRWTRDELERASLSDLGQLIDALDRPWAPAENDRLRAHFHQAGRDPSGHAKSELAHALARTIEELSPEDLSSFLRKTARSPRLSPRIAEQLIVCLTEVVSEVVVQLLGGKNTHRKRRHRHGR
jgi:hypothetical protein